MRIRLHYQISFVKASVSMLLFLFPMTAALTAQEITHSEHQPKAQTRIVDIMRDPADVPPGIGNRQPAVVHVMLTAEEVVGTLDPSARTTYRYWTFNGKVPGPMIRVSLRESMRSA
jgi:nitrite reductase (NO-forming)